MFVCTLVKKGVLRIEVWKKKVSVNILAAL